MSDNTNLLLKDVKKRERLQEREEFFFGLASKFHSFAVSLAFFTVGGLIANALFNDGLMANIVLWSGGASAFLLILSFIFICIEMICIFKINKLTKK